MSCRRHIAPLSLEKINQRVLFEARLLQGLQGLGRLHSRAARCSRRMSLLCSCLMNSSAGKPWNCAVQASRNRGTAACSWSDSAWSLTILTASSLNTALHSSGTNPGAMSPRRVSRASCPCRWLLRSRLVPGVVSVGLAVGCATSDVEVRRPTGTALRQAEVRNRIRSPAAHRASGFEKSNVLPLGPSPYISKPRCHLPIIRVTYS